VLVACSGGPDSLALAAALAFEAPRLGVRAGGITVDHGLQEGSAEQAARVAATLRELGLDPVACLRAEVPARGAAGPYPGPEAAARQARYAVIEAAAVEYGAAAVLLGHTMDDQAETVLLGLARGSGPRSIAGMRAWRPPWGRPLLGLRRSDTELTCRSAGLAPWQDPHNSNPAFTRVRVRREVLPLLDDVLGGGVRPALARTAELMAQDLDALDEIAATVVAQARTPDGSLDIAALRRQPAAIVGRVLRDWAMSGGSGPLTYEHLNRMAAQVASDHGPPQVRIPGRLDVVRAGGALRLEPH
jgi:tRNA(Ile)-lysidine synthase